jgi:hypothetical protein
MYDLNGTYDVNPDMCEYISGGKLKPEHPALSAVDPAGSSGIPTNGEAEARTTSLVSSGRSRRFGCSTRPVAPSPVIRHLSVPGSRGIPLWEILVLVSLKRPALLFPGTF